MDATLHQGLMSNRACGMKNINIGACVATHESSRIQSDGSGTLWKSVGGRGTALGLHDECKTSRPEPHSAAMLRQQQMLAWHLCGYICIIHRHRQWLGCLLAQASREV